MDANQNDQYKAPSPQANPPAWLYIVIGSLGTILYLIIKFGIFNSPQLSSPSTHRTDAQQTYGAVEFCKKVDDNLECISPGDRFKSGTVYVKVAQNRRFETNYIYLKIYLVKGLSESLFDEGSYEVNPEWATLAIPITFRFKGKYKVLFRKLGDEKIAEGIVTIY